MKHGNSEARQQQPHNSLSKTSAVCNFTYVDNFFFGECIWVQCDICIKI